MVACVPLKANLLDRLPAFCFVLANRSQLPHKDGFWLEDESSHSSGTARDFHPIPNYAGKDLPPGQPGDLRFMNDIQLFHFSVFHPANKKTATGNSSCCPSLQQQISHRTYGDKHSRLPAGMFPANEAGLLAHVSTSTFVFPSNCPVTFNKPTPRLQRRVRTGFSPVSLFSPQREHFIAYFSVGFYYIPGRK